MMESRQTGTDRRVQSPKRMRRTCPGAGGAGSRDEPSPVSTGPRDTQSLGAIMRGSSREVTFGGASWAHPAPLPSLWLNEPEPWVVRAGSESGTCSAVSTATRGRRPHLTTHPGGTLTRPLSQTSPGGQAQERETGILKAKLSRKPRMPEHRRKTNSMKETCQTSQTEDLRPGELPSESTHKWKDFI